MTNRSVRTFTFALSLFGLAATGCAGTVSHMTAVPNMTLAAAANESIVVFMRPSSAGFAVQSSVFEVVPAQSSHLVGIVAAKKKVAYHATPGDHLFMVVGESADFMQARLEPGKIYYALVTPRMGMWKARFSLQPVHAAERGALPQWQGDTEWVAVNADSAQWAADNAGNIDSKRDAYLPKWNEKAERPVLMPEDGQ
ncbi:MAG TPA: hypothetical protein VK989_16590 [Polyangia bacterium]|jgi:hypothetical protein|nr:hypothetical protein [Polyangia bacterium]